MHPEGTGLAADRSLDDVGEFFQAHLCFLGEIRACLCTDHVGRDPRHPYIERLPTFPTHHPYLGYILKLVSMSQLT